jgi:hypothetical protein
MRFSFFDGVDKRGIQKPDVHAEKEYDNIYSFGICRIGKDEDTDC